VADKEMTPDGGVPLESVMAGRTVGGRENASSNREIGSTCGVTTRIIAQVRHQPCRKRVSGVV
jgi:hypothetical protein